MRGTRLRKKAQTKHPTQKIPPWPRSSSFCVLEARTVQRFAPATFNLCSKLEGLHIIPSPLKLALAPKRTIGDPYPKPKTQGLLCAFSCFRFEIMGALFSGLRFHPRKSHRVHLTSRCVVALLHEERSRSSAKDGRLFAWGSRGRLGRLGLVAGLSCRLQRLRVAVAGGGWQAHGVIFSGRLAQSNRLSSFRFFGLLAQSNPSKHPAEQDLDNLTL